MKKPLPSQSYLRDCFDYNPETGVITYKARPAVHFEGKTKDAAIIALLRNARMVGKSPKPNCSGYVNVSIDSVSYRAHRVIWKLVHGYDPIGIDHINGCKSDNRLCNLREADQSVNAKNNRMRSDNTSNFTGVYFDRARSKWTASIWADGRQYNLGRFRNIEDAIAARKAAQANFGFTARHGVTV